MPICRSCSLRRASRRAVSRRRGNIIVFSAIMMVMLMAMLAFSLDIGSLLVARSELQRTADAAAIAAAWDLMPSQPESDPDYGLLSTEAHTTAVEFAALNDVLQQAPELDASDITVGYLADLSDSAATIDTSGTNQPNCVQVRVRRTAVQNGNIPFFFAQVLGFDQGSAQAQATAALLNDFNGFQAPSDGSNLGMLPFAMDLGTWNDMLSGLGSDDWSWNEELQEIQAGADGILEMNLYPQGTGSPGNRGTVDVGGSNNSTNDIARQIVHGVSDDDLEQIGGHLEFDENGEIFLNGDTGISAGVKDELASIKGEPRIIPLFAQVSGPGNNAEYTITKFVGIRIMDVKLTGKGSSKRVMVQPAQMITKGGIPGDGGGRTEHVYSRVWLIR